MNLFPKKSYPSISTFDGLHNFLGAQKKIPRFLLDAHNFQTNLKMNFEWYSFYQWFKVQKGSQANEQMNRLCRWFAVRSSIILDKFGSN